MKQQINTVQLAFLIGVLACLTPATAWNQCNHKLTHLTGTQQVGCHEVTVTPEGATGSITSACGFGPYRVGLLTNSGSFTFTFSPPVPGVRVNFSDLNNLNGNVEELRFDINGSFYPITVPGVPTSCSSPAIITPSGTLGALPGQAASWKDLVITENITTLKIGNVVLSGSPHGVVFSLYFCSACCQTDAGNLVASPLHLCPGNVATVPDATQTFLESNDTLRYILFSDLNDTLGSILATSVTPVFPFDAATMQTGVTYYIAAMAGNNLNGNVDINDPCLDFSDAVPVTWHPKPAVTFEVTDPNVCAGSCTTVTIHLTGTAPFILTYTLPVTGPVTQSFTGNTGTIQVCTGINTQPGSLLVQATSLTDAWCLCTN